MEPKFHVHVRASASERASDEGDRCGDVIRSSVCYSQQSLLSAVGANQNPTQHRLHIVHCTILLYMVKETQRERTKLRACALVEISTERVDWEREAGGGSVYRNHQTIDQMLFFPSIDTMAERCITNAWMGGGLLRFLSLALGRGALAREIEELLLQQTCMIKGYTNIWLTDKFCVLLFLSARSLFCGASTHGARGGNFFRYGDKAIFFSASDACKSEILSAQICKKKRLEVECMIRFYAPLK